MKTPDEIKKGLELCTTTCGRECPYHDDMDCSSKLEREALFYILQLEERCNHMNQLRDAAAGRALKMEERVQQLEAERDALMGYLRKYGCDSCLYDDYDGSEPPCINCTATRAMWVFEGVQKEE